MKRFYSMIAFLGGILLLQIATACGGEFSAGPLFTTSSATSSTGNGGHAGNSATTTGSAGGATGIGGSAGTGGDTGLGGTAGQGGTITGNGGAAGTGGNVGTGGAAGQGGNTGIGGSGGLGGHAGNGGTDAGATGTGGNAGTGGSDAGAACGDKVCNGDETCSTCAIDCGVCCGNGAIDMGEVCDGANFSGKSCFSQKGAGWAGNLVCAGGCKTVDSSLCTPICGDNITVGAEICDGSELSGQTCITTPGFNNGPLSCKVDCSGFDTSKCHPSPPTCNAGVAGTVNTTAGNAVTDLGFLLHYAEDPEYYSTAMPTTKTFTGVKLPGQLVLAGKEGVSFSLKNNGIGQKMPWYMTTLATLPVECSGDSVKTEACLSKVAKAFRCQNAPYLEGGNCPPPVTFTAQVSGVSASVTSPGWNVWLVDLTCP